LHRQAYRRVKTHFPIHFLPITLELIFMAQIDLRSDINTRPCAEMRKVIANAEVGEALKGEDPNVAALEQEVAEIFGHEAALFVPSATMANQLAIRVLATGGELLVHESAHIIEQERCAAAVIGSIQTRTLPGDRGRMSADQVASALRSGRFGVRTTMATVELTHNLGGGSIYDFSELQRISASVHSAGAALHCDASRIWNAHVKTGIALKDYGELFDTLSVCFSKGLGAPVGSALIGSKSTVESARPLCRQQGGGMHKAGMLAAGALHAMRHHLSDLAQDHANAQKLASLLTEGSFPGQLAYPVDTNIIMWDLPDDFPVDTLLDLAHREGVILREMRDHRLRLVTYRDLSAEIITEAARILCRVGNSVLEHTPT
jgi:threonine aldolase